MISADTGSGSAPTQGISTQVCYRYQDYWRVRFEGEPVMKHPVSPRRTRALVPIGWCWPVSTLTRAYATMKNCRLVSSKRVPVSGVGMGN